jgi:hypothetical protein
MTLSSRSSSLEYVEITVVIRNVVKYRSARRHIPGVFNLQQHSYKKLKTRTLLVTFVSSSPTKSYTNNSVWAQPALSQNNLNLHVHVDIL